MKSIMTKEPEELYQDKSLTEIFDTLCEAFHNFTASMEVLYDIQHHPNMFEYPTNDLEKAHEFFVEDAEEAIPVLFHRVASLCLFAMDHDCNDEHIHVFAGWFKEKFDIPFDYIVEDEEGRIYVGTGNPDSPDTEIADEEMSIRQMMDIANYLNDEVDGNNVFSVGA